MISNISKGEDEILANLRKKLPEENIIVDGVIEETVYNSLAPGQKLLFILKEVNGVTEQNWSLKQFVKEGGRKATWDNISKWVYGIHNLEKELTWQALEGKNDDNDFRICNLSKIAVMNLKKISGTHTTVNSEIWDFIRDIEVKHLLSKQIELYTPDITICCGTPTGDVISQLLNFDKWDVTSRGIWYKRTETAGVIIYYFHPEARVGENLLFYGLVDAIRVLTALGQSSL
jgi:hypothetical protein